MLFALLATASVLIGSNGQEEAQVPAAQDEIVFSDIEELFGDESEGMEIVFDDVVEEDAGGVAQ